MKTLILLLTTVFQTAYAQNMTICREIESRRSSKVEIRITYLRNIPMTRSEKNELDSKAEVHVQLNTIKSGRVMSSQSFNAVQTSADVQVWVVSKKQGFKLYQYLDEDNQDGFSITNSNGSKSEHRLNCTDK